MMWVMTTSSAPRLEACFSGCSSNAAALSCACVAASLSANVALALACSSVALGKGFIVQTRVGAVSRRLGKKH